MPLRSLSLSLLLSFNFAHASNQSVSGDQAPEAPSVAATCPWHAPGLGKLTPILEVISERSDLRVKFLESQLNENSRSFLDQHFPDRVPENEANLFVDGINDRSASGLVRLLTDGYGTIGIWSTLNDGKRRESRVTLTDDGSVETVVGLLERGDEIVQVGCVRLASESTALKERQLNPCLNSFSTDSDGQSRAALLEKLWQRKITVNDANSSTKKKVLRPRSYYACFAALNLM